MKPIYNRYAMMLLLAFLWTSTPVSAQLSVSSAPTATQLIQNVLLGPGVAANNIIYSGAATARGTFNCAGACNLGIASGVLLTSGGVNFAVGTNNSTGAGQGNGTGSDPNLNTLNPGGNNPQDLAKFEFDFTVATDSVRFRYVWASEEYSDYVGTSCNDVFGFFINGPGITGVKNIALIPGTAVPITINNVNNGQAPGLTSPTGPCTNCAYFRDNHGSTTIQYDGLTTVLTAATQVCPCETYHIKLAVQDFCDGNYDSGVFLEGNSFQSVGQIPLLNISSSLQVGDTIYICPGDSVQIGVNACRSTLWSTGDTTSSIWVTQPGIYYTSIANPPLCFAFSNFIYVQSLAPDAVLAANGPTTFCPGDSVTLSVTPGVSYLWSNGATTQNITVRNPGNYYCSVSYGQSANCADVSDTISVSYSPAIAMSISTSGPLSICQGQTVTLTSSTPNVNWSTGATSPSIVVSTAGNYTATPTDPGFCPIADTVALVVNTNPVVSVTGNDTICQGASSVLATGSTYTAYLWSNGQSSPTINATTAGVYSVTVTDGNGCTGSNSINVTVLTNPSPSISGDFDFCTGGSTVITATPGFTSYSWSTGGSSANLNITTAGSYSVTVTDAYGCTGNATQAVTALPLPAAAIGGVTAICQGASANLIANPAGMSYQWSNGAITPTIQPTIAGIYSLTVTDANGCTNTISQAVTVNNNPVPAITGTLQVCDGSSSTLNAGSGYAQYLWSNGSTTSGIQVQTSGTYVVTVSDANGCSGTTSAVFTVLPFTVPSITAPAGFCSGSNAAVAANAGYASYQWSNGANTASQNITSGGTYTVTVTAANGCSGNASVNVIQHPLPQPALAPTYDICSGTTQLLSPGNFASYAWSDGSSNSSLTVNVTGNYGVTVTDANGCTAGTTTTVTSHPLPQPSISGDSTLCSGETTILNAGSGYAVYQWSNGNTNQVISASTSGGYQVTVSDAYGCSGTTSFNIAVFPLPLASITGDPDICSGETSTMNTPGGQGSYLWSDGSNSNSVTTSTGGQFTVTVTSPDGCTATSAFTLTVHPIPVASYSPIQDIRCDEIWVKFNNTSVCEPGSVFTWQFGDGNGSSDPSPNHIYTDSGDYQTSLVVVSPYGCVDSTGQTITLTRIPPPEALFSQSHRIVSIFDAEVSFTNQSLNATRYRWSFDDGESSDAENPTHLFDKIGTQKIILTAFNGSNCFDEYISYIEVAPFYVPTAFSPNDDGKNDVFFDGTPAIKVRSYRMDVFNRWGENIYTTDSYLRPWDGLDMAGKPTPAGLYVYRILITSLKGKEYEFTGTFSLIR